jgi:hypothetical protein
MLAGAIALELLEAITGRDPEVVELLRGVDGHELTKHDPVEVAREASSGLAPEQPLRVPVREALDHVER